jgi:hypothetical protein
MLKVEIEFFNDHRGVWLTQFPGKIALVRGQALIGVFDTEDQAIAEGTRQFGLTAFLVRRIATQNPDLTVPALTLGLLLSHANTPFSVP